MILLREAREEDVDSLLDLGHVPGFFNLPQGREDMKKLVRRSVSSFRHKIKDPFGGRFVFVAEDIDTGNILGTSMTASRHGTESSPHYYFEVTREEKYSHSISTGFIHGVLKLKSDLNGPSEIGGLVVDRKHRDSGAALGKQISLVRFLFIAKNRHRFRDRILAELLPPLNRKQQSPLWEAIGRRFTNMDYWEADALCVKDKEFIKALFPTNKIYTAFLTPEARNAIGKVGKKTEAVVHMLKNIGFAYSHHVDPFDGGPHYMAKVKDIAPIRAFGTYRFNLSSQWPESKVKRGIICRTKFKSGGFRAMQVDASISGDTMRFTKKFLLRGGEIVRSTLDISQGTELDFIPFD